MFYPLPGQLLAITRSQVNREAKGLWRGHVADKVKSMARKPSVEHALEMRALPQQSSSTIGVILGFTVDSVAPVLAPIKPTVGGMSVSLLRRGMEAEEKL